jgi:hypothetical protein
MPRARLDPLPDLVRSLPARQLIHLWIAIFSTFSSLGFILDVLARGRHPAPLLALNVVVSGLLAIGYAKAALPRRRWGLVAMIAIHLTYVVVSRFFTPLSATPPGRLVIDAIGMIVAVTVGYTFFLTFISITATRYLRAQAEIAIARDIHRVLVPTVERHIGDFEFLGWSVASGDVGGDRRSRPARQGVARLCGGCLRARRRTRGRDGHVQERAPDAHAGRWLDSLTARRRSRRPDAAQAAADVRDRRVCARGTRS